MAAHEGQDSLERAHVEWPSGARILVVDDDDAMREVVSARLVQDGFAVREASSAVEVLHLLDTVAPERWKLDGVDLIVLDNRMPGMTGLEAIQRLRARHQDVPAVLMTAFPEPIVTGRAEALGVPVLSKPFSLDLLTSAVIVLLLEPNHVADAAERAS